MTKWVIDLAHELAQGRRAVIVTVAHATGSTPREAGATMVVTQNGLHGTIGGGHLEFEALRIARDALANAETHTSTWIVRFPLAARLGQCCGGVATLAFATVEAGPHAWLDTAVDCVRTSTPFALVTRVGGAHDTPSKLLVTLDDACGSLADGKLESAAIAIGARATCGGRNRRGSHGLASRGRHDVAGKRDAARCIPGTDLRQRPRRPRTGNGAGRAARAGALDRRARGRLPRNDSGQRTDRAHRRAGRGNRDMRRSAHSLS